MCVSVAISIIHLARAGRGGRSPAPVDRALSLHPSKQLICFFMVGPGNGDKKESLLNCRSSFFLPHTKTACIAISCHIQKIRTLNGSKLLFWKSAKREKDKYENVVWGEKKIIWTPCRGEASFLFWQGEESCLSQAELTFRTLSDKFPLESLKL